MLNTEEKEIHSRAIEFSRTFKSADAPLLRALTDAFRTRLFVKFGRTGLFRYAVDILKIDEAVARPYITVAKKCVEFPEVLTAVEAGRFPTAKAARIVSVLKKSNVAKFIEYAATLSYEELNHKVADENPQKKKRSIHRPTGNGGVRGSYSFDREFTDALTKEAERPNLDPALVIQKAVLAFIERHDPVQKAKRARKTKQDETKPPKELCVDSISLESRKPIPAATRHAINRRDGAQCTHVHENGERCANRRWLHAHHIKHVEDGGTNELENLITLCSIHHEMRHQMEFKFDHFIERQKFSGTGNLPPPIPPQNRNTITRSFV